MIKTFIALSPLKSIISLILSAFLTTFLLNSASFAEELQSVQEDKKIVNLLGYVGGKDTPKIMSNRLLTQLTQIFPKESDKTWESVNQLLEKEQAILRNQTIAIFKDEFTPQDIDAMLTFYQSDAGKKMLASLPSVTRRTRQVNQLWSKSVIADIEDMLIKERKAQAALKENSSTE